MLLKGKYSLYPPLYAVYSTGHDDLTLYMRMTTIVVINFTKNDFLMELQNLTLAHSPD